MVCTAAARTGKPILLRSLRAVRNASAVRWGVAGNIVWAWVLTIPASAFVAAVAYWLSLTLF